MKGRTGLKSPDAGRIFPAQDYPFAMMTLSPYAYIAELEAMRTGGEVCQLMVSDTPISMPCLIAPSSSGKRTAAVMCIMN